MHLPRPRTCTCTCYLTWNAADCGLWWHWTTKSKSAFHVIVLLHFEINICVCFSCVYLWILCHLYFTLYLLICFNSCIHVKNCCNHHSDWSMALRDQIFMSFISHSQTCSFKHTVHVFTVYLLLRTQNVVTHQSICRKPLIIKIFQIKLIIISYSDAKKFTIWSDNLIIVMWNQNRIHQVYWFNWNENSFCFNDTMLNIIFHLKHHWKAPSCLFWWDHFICRSMKICKPVSITWLYGVS